MRLHADFKTLVLLSAAVAGLASRSDAAIITVPPGLSPGDTYRLVFVTSTIRNATSSDIGVYNAFVQSVADASPDLSALGATWFAIASTASVNAIDNIGSPFPDGVYRLDGTKVADGTAGLFSGSILAPIYYTEMGGAPPLPGWVWTGTDPGGNASSGPLGGSGSSTAGSPYWNDSGWIIAGPAPDSTLAPFYAISSEITVGEAVPEPASICLTTLGGAILLFAMRRNRRNPLAMQANRTPPARY